MSLFKASKPLIYKLDPEKAHNTAISLLKRNLVPSQTQYLHPNLESTILGLDFKHPVGLAAGFDKNAEAIPALFNQGFSFIEAGTVTPIAQDGNDKPRLFRLEDDEAIINRMGFNNKGIEYFHRNIKKAKLKSRKSIIGANIGKNKNSPNDASDYLTLLDKIYGDSDYITINISSPNTPNLRQLQKKETLEELLKEITDKKKELSDNLEKNIPILLKIAPDLNKNDCNDIVNAVMKYDISGIIVSNTTISRPESLKNNNKNEQGGLSGKPVFDLSTETLKEIYKLSGGNIPLIGVGGIFNGFDAYKKIKSGASLIQIYSCLIYEGFEAINKINKELSELLEKDGFANISEVIGSDIS